MAKREAHQQALDAIRQAMHQDFADRITVLEGRGNERREVVIWDPQARLEQLDAHLATVTMVINLLFDEQEKAQAEVNA